MSRYQSVNDSWILEGRQGRDGLCWQQLALFNYSGQMVDPPLCGAYQPMDGCLLLGHVTKTAAGGGQVATITGPWALDNTYPLFLL